MVDVEDVQGYRDKFSNQLDKLREANIAEADRQAIEKFVRSMRANDEVQVGTLVGHLNRLRLSAERADTKLTDMDKDAVDQFLFELDTEYELAEGTQRNYRKALRKFFQHRDTAWADDISIGASPDRTVEPNELLSMAEIESMLDVSTNTRDTALLALLADTGMRISAVTSLRRKDHEYTDGGAVVTPNTDGPVKDATDPVPLTWSAGYVGNWLDVHPRNAADAALFHKTEHVDPDEDGALTYQYAARRIKRIADDAGVDRKRVNTHNFRKSAISRWIREGLPEQVIKHRASWAEDSGQFEVYSGVTSEELNEQVFEHYGLASGEDSRPELDACPQCRTALTDTASYCPGCGAALSASARDAMDVARNDTMDGATEAATEGNPNQASFAKVLDDVLGEFPEARDAVRDALNE